MMFNWYFIKETTWFTKISNWISVLILPDVCKMVRYKFLHNYLELFSLQTLMQSNFKIHQCSSLQYNVTVYVEHQLQDLSTICCICYICILGNP